MLVLCAVIVGDASKHRKFGLSRIRAPFALQREFT